MIKLIGANGERKPRLLVVDDEPGNLLTFKRVLRALYDIRLASSGEEALSVLEAETPESSIDAVLVDYAMPVMNGAQFLAQLRKKHPTLPCLFVTAYAEVEEIKAAGKLHGVVAVIMKPWEREDVERWVDQSIRIAEMKRSLARNRV